MPTDPKASRTSGYHLFLEPEGEVRDQCERNIQKLAAQYGGPVFPPHVTLAARIEARSEDLVHEQATELAGLLSPFTLSLGTLSGEASFFRALYSTIATTPELLHAHKTASVLFGLPDETYQPHLSLFYGLIDDDRRDVMKEEVGTVAGSFMIDRVHLYRTEGSAEMWEKIAEYPFTA